MTAPAVTLADQIARALYLQRFANHPDRIRHAMASAWDNGRVEAFERAHLYRQAETTITALADAGLTITGSQP